MPYEVKYYTKITIELGEAFRGKRLRALNQKTESLKQQRDSVLDEYDIVAKDANSRFEPLVIYKARKDIRPEKEEEIKDKLP